MEEPKFTQGPWKWTQFNDQFGARCFIVPVGESTQYPLVIAEVEHGFATCNLVAAAPEMFDALRDLVDYTEETGTHFTSDDHPHHPLYRARAVLEKVLVDPLTGRIF